MSEFLKSLIRSEGKSCEGKIKYPREDSAIRNAQAMMLKKGNDEVFEHYKCAYCNGWHIGHRTNFDWIPKSHTSHHLMLNKYRCVCGFEWITNTVFSSRILDHFPLVTDAPEHYVKCPRCKNTTDRSWDGRIWVKLEDVDPNSTETVESLWQSNSQPIDTSSKNHL